VPAIAEPVTLEPQAHKSATILVVDDESIMRALIAEVLEGMGHVVIGVADAGAAMRVLFSQATIDLLIADIGLPGGMDGYQLAELARRRCPDLKVLFVTGYVGDSQTIVPPTDTGMQVLAKPFALNALASRVKKLIAAR
jgi:CheY-like chemotaxis protein